MSGMSNSKPRAGPKKSPPSLLGGQGAYSPKSYQLTTVVAIAGREVGVLNLNLKPSAPCVFTPVTSSIPFQVYRRHVRIGRLIDRFPEFPRPVSGRIDQHLSRAEEMEAAFFTFTATAEG